MTERMPKKEKKKVRIENQKEVVRKSRFFLLPTSIILLIVEGSY